MTTPTIAPITITLPTPTPWASPCPRLFLQCSDSPLSISPIRCTVMVITPEMSPGSKNNQIAIILQIEQPLLFPQDVKKYCTLSYTINTDRKPRPMLMPGLNKILQRELWTMKPYIRPLCTIRMPDIISKQLSFCCLMDLQLNVAVMLPNRAMQNVIQPEDNKRLLLVLVLYRNAVAIEGKNDTIRMAPINPNIIFQYQTALLIINFFFPFINIRFPMIPTTPAYRKTRIPNPPSVTANLWKAKTLTIKPTGTMKDNIQS